MACWEQNRSRGRHMTTTVGLTDTNGLEEKMSSRSRKLILALSLFAVSLLLFAGAALAQETEPAAPEDEGKTRLELMQEWMGPEAWAAMVERMTQIHGAEFTGQMMERMAEEDGCPGPGFMHNWSGRWSDESGEGFWGNRGDGTWGNRGPGFHGMRGGMMHGWGR